MTVGVLPEGVGVTSQHSTKARPIRDTHIVLDAPGWRWVVCGA